MFCIGLAFTFIGVTGLGYNNERMEALLYDLSFYVTQL